MAADLERELLTAEDFLDWLTPEREADLIDGEIFMHSPVSIQHADLVNFLDRLLGTYVDRHRLGFLYREVVAVRLSSRNVFLPDLAFYRTEKKDRIRQNHDPDTLAHRFYRRQGELLVEYAAEAARIESAVVVGFCVLRDWLDPRRLPSIDHALSQIPRPGG